MQRADGQGEPIKYFEVERDVKRPDSRIRAALPPCPCRSVADDITAAGRGIASHIPDGETEGPAAAGLQKSPESGKTLDSLLQQCWSQQSLASTCSTTRWGTTVNA
jgi:hypothetical protein